MRILPAVSCCSVAVVLLVGCSGGSLQDYADGGGGDHPTAGDAPGPLANGRSFVVTSNLTQDGGGSLTHTFTLAVLENGVSGIVGANGSGAAVTLEGSAASGYRIRDKVDLPVP